MLSSAGYRHLARTGISRWGSVALLGLLMLATPEAQAEPIRFGRSRSASLARPRSLRGLRPQRATGGSAREVLVSFNMDPKWVGSSGADKFLSGLKQSGVGALEFALQPQAADWPEVRALVEASGRLGLKRVFHLPYQNEFNLVGFSSSRRNELMELYRPSLEYAAELGKTTKQPTTLVIHGARGTESALTLRRDTQAFLKWASKRYPNVHLALELLNKDPAIRKTGDTKPELERVVTRMCSPRVGICWDMGHDAQNGHTPTSSRFFNLVTHVHVHDVSPDGNDHFPFAYGNVRYQKDLTRLVHSGFGGVVTLEVKGANAAKAAQALGKDPWALMSDSLLKLRREIDGARPVVSSRP